MNQTSSQLRMSIIIPSLLVFGFLLFVPIRSVLANCIWVNGKCSDVINQTGWGTVNRSYCEKVSGIQWMIPSNGQEKCCCGPSKAPEFNRGCCVLPGSNSQKYTVQLVKFAEDCFAHGAGSYFYSVEKLYKATAYNTNADELYKCLTNALSGTKNNDCAWYVPAKLTPNASNNRKCLNAPTFKVKTILLDDDDCSAIAGPSGDTRLVCCEDPISKNPVWTMNKDCEFNVHWTENNGRCDKSAIGYDNISKGFVENPYNVECCCDPTKAPPATPPANSPLYFIPQVTLPGTFDKGVKYELNEENYIFDYIHGLYRWSIWVMGILSAVMMMIGGIIWVVSAGNQKTISTARSMIIAGLSALILLLFSYTLLATINSDILVRKTLIYDSQQIQWKAIK